MSSSYSKLDQALVDLVEAFTALREDMQEKYSNDEEAVDNSIVEILETSVETAIEEQDSSTTNVAALVSLLSEALEQLDPHAFEGDEEEEEEERTDYSSMDDDDIDYDEDLEDEDEDEDED